MVDLNDFLSIGGLAGIVLAIVKFLRLYFKTEHLPLVSVVVGMVLAELFAYVLGLLLSPADVVAYLVGGFLAGLSASGGYDLGSMTKRMLGR